MDDNEREVAQQKAQRALDNAVEEYFKAHEWDRGMILTGWVLVSHQAGYENGEDKEAYPIIYMDGSLSDHVAIGLLNVGIDIVRGVKYAAEKGESDADD